MTEVDLSSASAEAVANAVAHEDALAATPDAATLAAWRRALWPARIADTAIFFINGTAIGFWAAHIPLLKQAHQLSEARLSVVLLGFALGAIVTMMMSGWLAARWGSGRVTLIAALAFCTALPAASLAPSVALMFVGAVLLGACNGALDVAMNAYATTLERAWRAPIMSSFHAFFSLGGLAGAAVSGLLIARGLGAHTNMPLASLGLSLIVLASARLLLKPEPGVHPHGHGEADASAHARTSQVSGRPPAARKAPKLALPSKGLVRLGAIGFCAAIAEGAMVDWTGVYLSTVLGAAAAFAAAGYAACSLSMTIGRLTGDAVIVRAGRRETLIASGLLAAFGLTLAVLAGAPVTAALGFGIAGFGLANIIPIVYADAGHAIPNAPGVGVATVATMGYAGFLLGPPVIGFTAGVVGLRLALVFLVLASMAIAVLGLRHAPRPEA